MTDLNFTISSSSSHIAVINAHQKAYIWGDNKHGQLGLGDTTERKAPQLLPLYPGTTSPWKNIACGQGFTMGLTEDGHLYVWGLNQSCQLGLGDSKRRTLPTLLRSPSPNSHLWKKIFCGDKHAIGIDESGYAYCWGNSTFGQLGFGVTCNYNKPTRIFEPTEWIDFICGPTHTLGKTFDGRVYVWGLIGKTTTDVVIPKIIVRLSDDTWGNFVCGERFVIGNRNDAKLYTWGNNKHCQLKLSDVGTNMTHLPVVNSGVLLWKEIFCGSFHVIGLTFSNKAYVWGQNSNGELGLGNDNKYDTAQHLPPPNNQCHWKTFICGPSHTIGVTSSGEMYVWGQNKSGMFESYTEKILSPTRFRFEKFVLVEEEEKLSSSSVLNLIKSLHNENFSDLKIDIYHAHSALVSLRCPPLLDSKVSETMRKDVLAQLMEMIYGATISTTDVETNLYLYKFVISNELEEFRQQILENIKVLCQVKENLVKVLKLADDLGLGDVETIALESVDIFSEDELQTNPLMKDLSPRLLILIGKNHGKTIVEQTKRRKIEHNARTLGQCLKIMHETGIGHDLVLNVSGYEFRVHKFVLSLRNEYFRALLEPHTKESQLDRIELKDCLLTGPVMKKFLYYIYCNETPELNLQEATEFLTAQDFFIIDKQFIDTCQRICQNNLSVDNCLDVFAIAYERNHTPLINSTLDIIKPNLQRLIDSRKTSQEWMDEFAMLLVKLAQQ